MKSDRSIWLMALAFIGAIAIILFRHVQVTAQIVGSIPPTTSEAVVPLSLTGADTWNA